MRSLQKRCLGEISDSKREKEKENHEAKRGSKGKGKKGKKGNSKFSVPVMETKDIHPMTVAKERADMTKEIPKRYAATARRSADCTIHRAYLCRLDRPRLGSIMEFGIGVNQAGTHPMRHPAQDKHESVP